MGMNSDYVIEIFSKKTKSGGKKLDVSHDISYLDEVPPYLRPEILDHKMDEAMSPALTSFINSMWELAADEDPWYETILEMELADA